MSRWRRWCAASTQFSAVTPTTACRRHHRRELRRQDPGGQRRLQRQVSRGTGPGHRRRGVRDYRYRLLPIFLEPAGSRRRDGGLHRRGARPLQQDKLAEELAVADTLLYRRGQLQRHLRSDSSATRNARRRRPDRAVAGVFAGAPPCFRARPSPWSTSWIRRPSPIPKPTCGK